MTPIRVFIGSEKKTELMRHVLQSSILEAAPQNKYEFIPMIGPEWEYPTEGLKVGTGFSLRRWMIPAYCNWQGRAIYLDADQLVFGDLRELWNSFDPAGRPYRSVILTKQKMPWSTEPILNSSVMAIHCEIARKNLTNGESYWELPILLSALHNATRDEYLSIMYPTWLVEPGLVTNHWNSLDAYSPDRTKLLHYTDEPSQPPYNPDHRHAGLWRDALCKAIHEGRIPEDVWQAAVDLWTAPRLDKRKTQGLHPRYHELWHMCAKK